MEDLGDWGKEVSPFHEGEHVLQERAGIRERQERIGRQIIRPAMPDQHREFFAQLPFLFVGSVDGDGAPWASVVFGKPGFVSSPHNTSLVSSADPLSGDPLAENIAQHAPVSVLGIELPTRRRNRMNGLIEQSDGPGFGVRVIQSFGNCPQYIQTREVEWRRDPDEPFEAARETFTAIDQDTADLIRRSDTFFVASYHPEGDATTSGGVDINHRGGRAGFVRVDGNTLTVPDYMGNFAFNTLGNFLLYPRAGMLFIDFESGDIVMMTGTVELLLEKTPELEAFTGAQRGWTFTLSHGLRLKGACPMRFAFGEYSPNSAMTDTWDNALKKLDAQQRRKDWLPYKVVRIEQESETIKSFYLAPDGDHALFDHLPGQFLPICTQPEGKHCSVMRTYTLSSAPGDHHYRISVKRDGSVSSHLHDQAKVGDIIKAQAPAGAFTFDPADDRPAVLIAGGVGITPMLSMARAAAKHGVSHRHVRPVTVIHSASTTAERAFVKELTALAQGTQNAVRYFTAISKPRPGEKAGEDFHLMGRIDGGHLQKILPIDDYEFYLCGPPPFMQAMYETLRGLGVRDARILAESFGPASLQRKPDEASPAPARTPEADSAVVGFTASGFEQGWGRDAGTLLEFAEAHGLSPAYGCRAGQCGSCAVRMTQGEISYRLDNVAKTADGEVLICCAVPAKDTAPLKLEL